MKKSVNINSKSSHTKSTNHAKHNDIPRVNNDLADRKSTIDDIVV